MLTAADTERRPAHHRERHVAAQVGGQRQQLGSPETGAPQRVAGDQGAGRVGAAARQPAGDRDALADVQVHVGVPAGLLGEQQRGLCSEVGLVDRHRADVDARARLDRDLQAVAGARHDLVEKRDRVIDGGHVVEAVWSRPTDCE